MQLPKDVWGEVCWQLVVGRAEWPDHDTCGWRLPWAQLLEDIGNLSCTCKAARDGCNGAMQEVGATLRHGLEPKEAETNRILQPVVEGRPFSLRAARAVLPFTAASRGKLVERLRSHLFLQGPTTMPMEVLEKRRVEGSQAVDLWHARFLSELHSLGDPTARKLLRFEWSKRLEGPAFNVVRELRLKFGTSEHGWRYARRLAKQQGRNLAPPESWCGCDVCSGWGVSRYGRWQPIILCP